MFANKVFNSFLEKYVLEFTTVPSDREIVKNFGSLGGYTKKAKEEVYKAGGNAIVSAIYSGAKEEFCNGDIVYIT